MLKRLRQLGDAGVDFAFESTLSSRTFAPFLRKLKAQGYQVVIYPRLSIRKPPEV